MAEENGNISNKEVKVSNVFDDTNVNTISLETPRARAARQLAEMAASAKRATPTKEPDEAPTANTSTLAQQLQEVRRRKHAEYVKQRGEATSQAASTTGTAEYLAWLRARRAAIKGKLKAAAEEMKRKEGERKRDEATETAAAARLELIRQGLVDESVRNFRAQWQERKREQATKHDKAQRRSIVDQLEKEKEKYDSNTEIEERRNIYKVEKALKDEKEQQELKEKRRREDKDREQTRANLEAIAESLSSLSTSNIHPPSTGRSLKGPHTASRPTPTPRHRPIHPNNPQSRKQRTEAQQQAAKKRNDEATNQEVEKNGGIALTFRPTRTSNTATTPAATISSTPTPQPRRKSQRPISKVEEQRLLRGEWGPRSLEQFQRLKEFQGQPIDLSLPEPKRTQKWVDYMLLKGFWQTRTDKQKERMEVLKKHQQPDKSTSKKNSVN